MNDFQAWRARLQELADGIRTRTRDVLTRALEEGREESLWRIASQGAGDVTFGLDVPAEEWIDAWLAERAREGPLSLMTEDQGWRHLGPSTGGGAPRPLPDFDHGGPRIAIDPIDGTRNLMANLRSAWTVIAYAPPGADQPHLHDVTGGLVGELPTVRADRYLTFVGSTETPGCGLVDRRLADDAVLRESTVRVDQDDRVDNGYFPFFRYKPELRPALARLEADFFARLERLEGADVRSCYDDQYISNAGQMMLLIQGTYRLVVDARALVAKRAGIPTVTSKPYDVAGAILCARAAGVELTTATGAELDFPIDTETPVDFVGYANAKTRTRLEPHWLAVVG